MQNQKLAADLSFHLTQLGTMEEDLACKIQYDKNDTSNLTPPPSRPWKFTYHDEYISSQGGFLHWPSIWSQAHLQASSERHIYDLFLKILKTWLVHFTVSNKYLIRSMYSIFTRTGSDQIWNLVVASGAD